MAVDAHRILASRSGFYLADAVIPITLVFTVIRAGGSAATVGIVLAVQNLVGCCAIIPAGVLADRTSRRLVIWAGDGMLVCVYAATGIFLLTHSLNIPGLTALMVARAVLVAGGRPALTGLIAERIPSGQRNKMNGKLSMSDSLTWLVGPAIVGLLLVRLNSGWIFVGCACLCLFAFAVLCSLPAQATKDPNEASPSTAIGDDIRDAWRAIRARRWYLVSLFSHTLGGFGLTSILVLGPLVYSETVDGSASWGIVVASGSVGALVGGFAVFKSVPRRPLFVVNGLVGLASLEAFSLAFRLPILFVALSFLIGTLFMVYLNEVWATVVQDEMPLRFLSSTSSFDWMVSLASAPIGYFFAGLAARQFGASPVLLVSGVIVAIAATMGAVVPSVRTYRRAGSTSVDNVASAAAYTR